MKRSITQKHYAGCAAACIAFITSEPYENIINKIGDKKAELYGLSCKEIVTILNDYNKSYEYRHVKVLDYKVILNGTIVFLKRSKQYPMGHYLVTQQRMWMDPWINYEEEKYIKYADSGFKLDLPYEPSYVIYPVL